jgi:hypothetical protein
MAFIDLTGSFIILTTVSYAIPIVANMLTSQKYLPKGPFQLGRGATRLLVGWGAVVLIMFFNVFYCFRGSSPFLSPSFMLFDYQADLGIMSSIFNPYNKRGHELQ